MDNGLRRLSQNKQIYFLNLKNDHHAYHKTIAYNIIEDFPSSSTLWPQPDVHVVQLSTINKSRTSVEFIRPVYMIYDVYSDLEMRENLKKNKESISGLLPSRTDYLKSWCQQESKLMKPPLWHSLTVSCVKSIYSRARLIRTANVWKNRGLSKHANYQSLFYVTFLLTVESCVQSKCAN